MRARAEDRSAQIDTAITRKAIPQLGMHLHTLGGGSLSSRRFSEVGEKKGHRQAARTASIYHAG